MRGKPFTFVHVRVKQYVPWMAIAGVVLIGGCAKPLFPMQDARTQYDHYDRLRGDYVPQTRTDAYGQTQPALRARLLRK